MNTDSKRVENLTGYVHGLLNNENGKELYLKYRSDIEKVSPQEAFEIFYNQLEKGYTAEELLTVLDKVINVFYKSLSGYKWDKPESKSFIGYLMQENTAVKNKLDGIKVIIRDNKVKDSREQLLEAVRELHIFDEHYRKKENILFPYLEKKMKKFDGLSIMWALHDETRKSIKRVIELLEKDSFGEDEFSALIGTMFFAIHGLVQKEELILFPAASETINEDEWQEMQRQSLEYGFPFIEAPKAGSEAAEAVQMPSDPGELPKGAKDTLLLKTETGSLDLEQILLIFNSLPVDITFVDENNRVRFFTRPKDRIFPRSPAVIGRNVEKCHPPESVHVVNEIIDNFKVGSKDSAVFWINARGRNILIKYFALRDSNGTFRGTLEVSQDITEIKELQGERRLLQWGKD